MPEPPFKVKACRTQLPIRSIDRRDHFPRLHCTRIAWTKNALAMVDYEFKMGSRTIRPTIRDVSPSK